MDAVSPDRKALEQIENEVVECRRCPRLVAWRELVARQKVRRYAEWTYWGRPVPGFGDPEARVMIVGHEPDFSLLATHLLGLGDGSRLRIRKASLTHIELPAFAPGSGVLQFSVPCRLM